MNIFNHLNIARTTLQAIEKEVSVRLDPMAFRYGNIKPDISPSLFRIPHIKESAMDFIKGEIKELVNYEMSAFPKCTKEFSQKLGIIMHFLSDFFCFVHSPHYTGSEFNHYVYEMHLSSYWIRNSGAPKMVNPLPQVPISPDYSSICGYIEETYEQYLKGPMSYATDKSYTLAVCSSVSLSVITACLMKDLLIAA